MAFHKIDKDEEANTFCFSLRHWHCLEIHSPESEKVFTFVAKLEKHGGHLAISKSPIRCRV